MTKKKPRLRTWKKALRADRAIEDARRERAIDRLEKQVRSCPYCSTKFEGARRLQDHLERSGCLRRHEANEARKRYDAELRPGRAMRQGLIDPKRQDLGKVVRGSLIHALMQKRRNINQD